MPVSVPSPTPPVPRLAPGLVPLLSSAIRVEVTDLIAVTTWTQVYANREAQPIEAVFNLPVPLGAVFLDLHLVIGERRLRGTIEARAEAREHYEEAIAKGDRGVLLEQSDEGQYTVSIGNLAPGLAVTLEVRYSQFLAQAGEVLRLRVPTVRAPRYGRSTLHPLDLPPVDALAEHPLDFALVVNGLLSSWPLRCASHPEAGAAGADGLALSGRGAFLDRDLVFEWGLPARRAHQTSAIADGERWLLAASFLPDFAARPAPRPLILVVDCSGSMAGSSIRQVRSTLDALFDRLLPADRIAILRFGSSHEWWSEGVLRWDTATEPAARRFAATLAADLGGTEIERAMLEAVDEARRLGGADVLLLSDGLVEDHWPERVTPKAKPAGCRIFALGIGAAAAEDRLRRATESTGGALDLVSPGEAVASRIEHMLSRIRLPAATELRVDWGTEVDWQVLPERLFAGDGVLLVASTATLPTRPITLHATAAGGAVRMSAPLSVVSGERATALRCHAAAQRLLQLDGDARRDFAVAQGLLCDATACVIVDVLADGDKVAGLPELRQVPHMHAAGHGGMPMAAAACMAVGGSDASMLRPRSAPLAAPPAAPGSGAPSSASGSPLFERMAAPLEMLKRAFRTGASPSRGPASVAGPVTGEHAAVTPPQQLRALIAQWLADLLAGGDENFDAARALQMLAAAPFAALRDEVLRNLDTEPAATRDPRAIATILAGALRIAVREQHERDAGWRAARRYMARWGHGPEAAVAAVEAWLAAG
jgi:Ca-activated chloride channel family protein